MNDDDAWCANCGSWEYPWDLEEIKEEKYLISLKDEELGITIEYYEAFCEKCFNKLGQNYMAQVRKNMDQDPI